MHIWTICYLVSNPLICLVIEQLVIEDTNEAIFIFANIFSNLWICVAKFCHNSLNDFFIQLITLLNPIILLGIQRRLRQTPCAIQIWVVLCLSLLVIGYAHEVINDIVVVVDNVAISCDILVF